ncbi:hypothetical protein [Larkinella ripae]
MLKNLNNSLLKYLDIAYFSKLFVLFAVLYYFNLFYWGLTDPRNYYSYFLDHYLNYIDWFGLSILHTARLFTTVFGFSATVVPPQILKTASGANVILSFSCLGFGILSFWVAFILAYAGHWQRKLRWGVAGVVFIWFINCCRITLLLAALEKEWKTVYLNHHDLFNLASYAIVLALIYSYTRESTVKVGATH